MGLIGWIRNRYYRSRLAKADRLVSKKHLSSAEIIYRKLLGRIDDALPHLAQMYSLNAVGAEQNISALQKLEQLGEYANLANKAAYELILKTHVDDIGQLAAWSFESGKYADAVSLILSIKAYRGGDEAYTANCHRYRAYECYSRYDSNPDEISGVIIGELKEYLPAGLDDLRYFADDLESDRKYRRAVSLMLPFVGDSGEFRQRILADIVSAAAEDDHDLKSIGHISSVCSDEVLCREAASRLVSESEQSAGEGNYKKSVRLDSLASEYFGDDKAFNVSRCSHALEEMAGRTDAGEIEGLLHLSGELRLTGKQILELGKRISEIAGAAEPARGFAVCRLFISGGIFDNIFPKLAGKLTRLFETMYLSLAMKLAAGNPAALVPDELLAVIRRNTDENSLPDVLSAFVRVLPYEKEFLESAIARIKREKSGALLEKYWKVSKSPVFITELVRADHDGYREMAAYISENSSLFLCTKQLRSAFCKAIDSFNDPEYILGTAESLIERNCDVGEYYVTSALKYVGGKTSPDQAAFLCHAISVIKDQRLIDSLKNAVRTLISESSFDSAEQYALSLDGIDSESDTLLAEAYFGRAQASSSMQDKLQQLFRVLDVTDRGHVLESFGEKRHKTLSLLAGMAASFQHDGDNESASKIEERLRAYHDVWLSLWIRLRNHDLEQIQARPEKIRFLRETVSRIAEVFGKDSELRAVTSRDYLDLWDELKTLTVEEAAEMPGDSAVDSLSGLRKQIRQYCCKGFVAAETDELTGLILKLKWSMATGAEAAQNFDGAVARYAGVSEECVKSFAERAEIRSLICLLKAGRTDSAAESRIISALDLKSHQRLKDDLAYRYACFLLRAGRANDAENFIKRYLPDERLLLSLCSDAHIRESERYLAEFNQKVKAMADGTMSAAEATAFRSEIDWYKTQVSRYLSDTASEFDAYKTAASQYMLQALFREGRYAEALDTVLTMYPDFLHDSSHLRLAAVAALGCAESGLAAGTKLRYAISLWLTAVYNDRIFVWCIENASWNEQYQFTLDGSLGNTDDDDFAELPDNVGFDDPEEGENISIKDVQESLVARMEDTVRKNYPRLEAFFNSEKSAIESLLGLDLDQPCDIAAPCVSANHKNVSASIMSALEYELDHYGNKESILKTGLAYGIESGRFGSYKIACQQTESCRQAVSGNYDTASAFSNLSNIRTYGELYGGLLSFVSGRMNDAVKQSMPYARFMDVYEPVCRAFNDSKLSFAFSSYANSEIIKRLNDSSMKTRDGIGYLVRIYKLDPGNVTVKQNVTGVVKSLALEAASGGSSDDRRALDSALGQLGAEFRQMAEDAEIQSQLSVIVDKVNGNSMSGNTALDKVYDLYRKTPDNDRICENLVTLCVMCIMEYVIGNKYGSSSVCRILDSLCSNRSMTFRKHSGKLRDSYNQIVGRLDYNIRQIVTNPAFWGTLNDNGKALARGLDYFNRLGEDDDPFRALHGLW